MKKRILIVSAIIGLGFAAFPLNTINAGYEDNYTETDLVSIHNFEYAEPAPTATPAAIISTTPAVYVKPTPKVKYTRDTVYTKTTVNVRKTPSKKKKAIATLSIATKVKRIGVQKNGWAIVKYQGKQRFIKNTYLSKKKPKVSEAYMAKYSASHFKSAGVVHYGGYRWTWYSQRVLPGGGLRIPGRHVDKDGYVCDKNDYICLASSTFRKGTVLHTPFGKQGKIYDSGCAKGTVDTYVNW